MKIIRLTVSHKEQTLRLLDFLALRFRLSKKKAKGLLDGRNVFVNRRRVWMAKHALKTGDEVEIYDSILDPPSKDGRADAATPAILFEDKDYLIVNKEPGILSTGENSVQDMLREHRRLPALAAAHRLDRETSGAFVLAKHAGALEKAILLFRKHCVKKTYHAIVAGRLNSPSRTITTPIDGRRAVTRVRTLDTGNVASHLQLIIETGRTHQIRKHLAAIGNPVLGDKQYGTRARIDFLSMRLDRHMLHASRIEFYHPITGERVNVVAPFPGDFMRCLKAFGLVRFCADR